MEPIYEVIENSTWSNPEWRLVVRRREGKKRLLHTGSTAVARILCDLLNADPLPEDRPPKYTVFQYAGTYYVQDDEGKTDRFVASFAVKHPDPAAAAQAECDRLNAEASNVQA